MKPLQIQDLDTQATAWIYPDPEGEFTFAEGGPEPGKLAFCLNYVSPRKLVDYRRKAVARGILRRKFRGGEEFFEDVVGKEDAADLLFAETFVSDWSGVQEQGKPIPYSAEKMALLLSKKQFLNKACARAVKELDSFFERSANGSSGS